MHLINLLCRENDMSDAWYVVGSWLVSIDACYHPQITQQGEISFVTK